MDTDGRVSETIPLTRPAWREGDETMDEPRAVIRTDGDQIVLDDPDGLVVIRAVEKHNCRNTLDANLDRVAHFKNRAAELGHTSDSVVIVLLNVDDRRGAAIADLLMPDHDWQQYRDRGEIPFARGLAGRIGIQAALELFDKEAAEKLASMKTLAVVVVDRGVAEVFDA